MPAAGWTVVANGFRYSDRTHARGPVTRALVKPRRVAKVVASRSGIAFTLDEAQQGSLGAVLTSGGRRYLHALRRVREGRPSRAVRRDEGAGAPDVSGGGALRIAARDLSLGRTRRWKRR